MDDFLQPVLDYWGAGLRSFDVAPGLVIAVTAAYVTPKWTRLLYAAVAATAVHFVVDLVVPVITGRTELHMPAMFEEPFWHRTLSLYVSYVILVGLFFLVKKLLIKAGGAK